MSKKFSRGPLLDHLDSLEAKCVNEDLTLQDIFDVLGTEGHFVLIAFLSVPFLQPIPLLGMSTPFGLLITIILTMAYFEIPPWLPRRWAQKKIPSKTVSMITEALERIVLKIAFIFHPRFNFLFNRPFKDFNMILLILNAILLAMPLPIPFSNAVPAWVILLQSLAHLEKDGLFILLSYIQTLVCIVYFFSIAKGIEASFNWLFF